MVWNALTCTNSKCLLHEDREPTEVLCQLQAPYTVSFSARSPFNLQLVGVTGDAFLSGIEIYQAYDPPSPPPTPLPPFKATNLATLRVNCGGPPIDQSPAIYWTNNCAALFSGIGTFI
jgi:hypothetical protein